MKKLNIQKFGISSDLSNTTTILNLEKPNITDKYNIDIQNNNMDKIDNYAQEINNSISILNTKADSMPRYCGSGVIGPEVAVVASSFREILFTSASIVDNEALSYSGGKIIVKQAGTYRISYSTRWSDVPTGTNDNCSAGVSINSSTKDTAESSTWETNYQRLTISSFKIRTLAIGDTISVLAFSTKGCSISGTYWIEKIK